MEHHINRNTTRKFLSGEDFKVYRSSRAFTYAELGRRLGVTPQAIRKFEHSGVPRVYALALTALDHGLEPWKPTDQDRSKAAHPLEKASLDFTF